jgi:hypothetical protein
VSTASWPSAESRRDHARPAGSDLEQAHTAAAARSAAPPGLGVADVSPELVDAVTRMLRLLDRPVLAPLIEREILWRLVTGPLGESVRQAGAADTGHRLSSEPLAGVEPGPRKGGLRQRGDSPTLHRFRGIAGRDSPLR